LAVLMTALAQENCSSTGRFPQIIEDAVLLLLKCGMVSTAQEVARLGLREGGPDFNEHFEALLRKSQGG